MYTRSIVLGYPSDWLVPVNPSHEAARRDTERWLRDLGVLADERAARMFDAMNVGWLTPRAGREARLPRRGAPLRADPSRVMCRAA